MGDSRKLSRNQFTDCIDKDMYVYRHATCRSKAHRRNQKQFACKRRTCPRLSQNLRSLGGDALIDEDLVPKQPPTKGRKLFGPSWGSFGDVKPEGVCRVTLVKYAILVFYW
jgi:hypothetical protein